MIKAWRIPSQNKIEPYGANKDCSFNTATWNGAHEGQTIWDLRVHPTDNLFLSAGSDSSVCLWQLPFMSLSEDSPPSDVSHSLLSRFRRTSLTGHQATVTSCSWIHQETAQFIVSY